MKNFPKLDLTFTADGGRQILVDATFRLNEASTANRKLVVDPPRGKYFRAICILMLLAKYRGESFADADGVIWFRDRKPRLTWIKTLGISFGKGAQQDFFADYFSNCAFLSASRGSGHNTGNKKADTGILPAAKYHARLLPLQNVRFFKAAQKSTGEKPSLLTGEELALFAERLERHETEKPDGWEPIVPEIVAETKRDRPVRPEAGAVSLPTEPAQPAYDSQSVTFSTRWRELNQVVRQRIEADGKKYDWYVVSSIPSFVLEWKTILCDACLNYNASIKLAYQSPTAVESNAAIRAQLLMYASRRKIHAVEGTKFMLKRLIELEDLMGGWVADTKPKTARGKKNRKGGFQFFESQVNHPFAGILAVPAGSTWSKVQTAPPGSFCLLQLFSLYQPDAGERCCLYLSDSSPMLNVYYNGILAYFTHGPEDGYLKAVNLPRKGSNGNA
jgi:hypothetical protein